MRTTFDIKSLFLPFLQSTQLILLPRSLKVFRERSIYPTKTLIPHKTVAGGNYLPTAKAEAMRETEVGGMEFARIAPSFTRSGEPMELFLSLSITKLQAQTTAGR